MMQLVPESRRTSDLTLPLYGACRRCGVSSFVFGDDDAWVPVGACMCHACHQPTLERLHRRARGRVDDKQPSRIRILWVF